MHVFIAALIALFVGFVAGTFWGRRLEQKAIGKVLFAFHSTDEAARSAVNRLWHALPYLEKHFHS